MNNRNIRPISPFVLFCQKVIPLAFDESMSYYECLCALTNYLYQEVIPAVNNNADAVTELQNYVKNYFDNLDVQDEINNKLDEMAESGQLADIIAQYLNLAGVLGYNTVNDMINASNLVNGSFARTYGLNTYNDGKGAFYKIRTLTTSDVIDGVNIIAVNFSNTLIAEKMPDYYINEINERINILTNRKIVIIGDSYAEGYTPDGNVTSWAEWVKSFLNLNNSNCIIKYYGGTGFCATNDTKNFLTLLNEVDNDNHVTDVIVAGGYNDTGYSAEQLDTAITNFNTACKTKFPNAKVHVGFIGWTTNASNLYNLNMTMEQYIGQCEKNSMLFMSNAQYTLHDYKLFSSDGIHPNQDGAYKLGVNITQCILKGSCDVIYSYKNIHLKNINSAISNQSNILRTLGCQFTNNLIQISTQEQEEITLSTPQHLDNSSGLYFKIADINYSDYNSYIIGDVYNMSGAYVPLIIRSTDYKYYNAKGKLYFQNGSIYLKVDGMVNSAGDNYESFNINQIQIMDGIQATFDGSLC